MTRRAGMLRRPRVVFAGPGGLRWLPVAAAAGGARLAPRGL
jgi:hypothetical protein